jgi:hypothetical protein
MFSSFFSNSYHEKATTRVSICITFRRRYSQYTSGKFDNPKQLTIVNYDSTSPPMQAIILEGKYWKRKWKVITAEYKKWRRFNVNKALGSSITDTVSTTRHCHHQTELSYREMLLGPRVSREFKNRPGSSSTFI